MTIHITLEGILATIGGAVVIVFVLYLVVGIFVLWRLGK